MGRSQGTPPWQELEQQAYHAYREWPIWLCLRQRELAHQLAKTQARGAPRIPPTSASSGEDFQSNAREPRVEKAGTDDGQNL